MKGVGRQGVSLLGRELAPLMAHPTAQLKHDRKLNMGAPIATPTGPHIVKRIVGKTPSSHPDVELYRTSVAPPLPGNPAPRQLHVTPQA